MEEAHPFYFMHLMDFKRKRNAGQVGKRLKCYLLLLSCQRLASQGAYDHQILYLQEGTCLAYLFHLDAKVHIKFLEV